MPANNPQQHIEILDWDSAHFGRKIARINVCPTNRENWEQALAECGKNKVECAYLLLDASDAKNIGIATEIGFKIADIRLTMDVKFEESIKTILLPHDEITEAAIDDIPALQKIAQKSHTNTRFFNDRGFERKKSAEMYRLWIKGAVESPEKVVFKAVGTSGAQGYISCIITGYCGKIGLLAVDETARGKGFGGKLINTALDYFQQKGCTTAETVTQGGSVTAQRLYQKYGFRAKHVQIWLHKWFG